MFNLRRSITTRTATVPLTRRSESSRRVNVNILVTRSASNMASQIVGTTYPPPKPYTLPTIHPRPLKPLEKPNTPCVYAPQLPAPARKSLLDEWYTLSTHLVPAARPRTTPYVPLPPLPQWSPNKNEFQASVQRTVDELVATKEAQGLGKLNHLEPNSRQMWNCINRYVRRGFRPDGGDRTGITLFMSHANGFPKEVCTKML